MDEGTARSRHLAIGEALRRALLPMLLLVLNAETTYAQVVTNIEPTQTAPLDLGTDVNTVGSTTEITGGTRPGGGTNLFHSFDFFTLGTGDTAYFMNDMQLPTSNIFARVIGGEASTIDGTLQTNNPLNAADPMNFGAANLWLVNPSGVLLGPNARVEVGGSVSMSTAGYLRFEDQTALFDMLSSPASLGLLDVAPVTAFGFTSPEPPAPITVQGSMLQVPEGQSLSLVGGDVTVQAETFEDGTMQAASLLAPGGQLNLVSVGSAGEVFAPSFQTGPNINGVSINAMGTVTIKEGAILDVSGQLDEFGTPIGKGNSGTVLVHGGQLVMMDISSILANTVGAVDGASSAVDIWVSQDVTLSNSSVISSSTSGAGSGGDVHVTASTLEMDSSVIQTQTFGAGPGGDVHVTAGSLELENAGKIITETFFGDGEGGDLFLNVGRSTLMGSPSGSPEIRSTNFNFGTGLGGNVTIQGTQGEGTAADSVVLSGGSRVVSETIVSGDGGQVAITARSLKIVDEGSTINSSTSGTGQGGKIVVGVEQLNLAGGLIVSHTDSPDPSAAVGGAVIVQGLAGTGSMAVSVTFSGLNSGIVSETFGSARLGDIEVYARTLNLTSGAEIRAGSPIDTGTAGNITVEADSVDISGGSTISSRAYATDAGQVNIATNALTLDNGSIITITGNAGRGGNIDLDVGSLSLWNGASINSSSTSPDVNAAGDAGNITINSDSTIFMQNSTVTTEASQASGGQIEINAPEMVRLIDSQVSTSVKGVAEQSDGGNITIDPQFVVLQNSQVIAKANAGAGGAISIIATSAFIEDPLSIVDASSTKGISGTINIQSPVQNIGGELTALSQEFSSAAALLAQQCAARAAGGTFSTFVVAAREGVPVEPGGFLASPLLTAELLGSNLSGRYPHSPIAAVTGSFTEYDAKPIQLAKLGDACR